MKDRSLITNLDKKDLKSLLRYYLESMPKETRPISLKQLVSMKLFSEVQDTLKKVYKANTGKELMSDLNEALEGLSDWEKDAIKEVTIAKLSKSNLRRIRTWNTVFCARH